MKRIKFILLTCRIAVILPLVMFLIGFISVNMAYAQISMRFVFSSTPEIIGDTTKVDVWLNYSAEGGLNEISLKKLEFEAAFDSHSLEAVKVDDKYLNYDNDKLLKPSSCDLNTVVVKDSVTNSVNFRVLWNPKASPVRGDFFIGSMSFKVIKSGNIMVKCQELAIDYYAGTGLISVTDIGKANPASMRFVLSATPGKIGDVFNVDVWLNYTPEGQVKQIYVKGLEIEATYDSLSLEAVKVNDKYFNYDTSLIPSSSDYTTFVGKDLDTNVDKQLYTNSVNFRALWLGSGYSADPFFGDRHVGSMSFKVIKLDNTTVRWHKMTIAYVYETELRTVTDIGIVSSASKNINEPSSVRIALPRAEDIIVGHTVNFTATLPDVFGNQVSYQPVWSVNLPDIASIDATTGALTCNKPGKVAITAKSLGGTLIDTKEVEVFIPAVLNGKVNWLGQQVTNPSGIKAVNYGGIKVELVDKAKSSVTTSTGSYVIDKLIAGRYLVRAVIPKYLPVKDKSVDLTAGMSSSVNFEFVPGDVYPDTQNKIDLHDLLKLARYYGTKTSDSKWDVLTDLDGDGTVGFVDWYYLKLNYGRTSNN